MHEIEASGPEATFRRRMREARLARRLTQRDLVDALAEVGLDMNQTGITRIEGGAPGITLHEAIALAAALDVAPVHLFLPIDDGPPVNLTSGLEVDRRKARSWARGTSPWSPRTTACTSNRAPAKSLSATRSCQTTNARQCWHGANKRPAGWALRSASLTRLAGCSTSFKPFKPSTRRRTEMRGSTRKRGRTWTALWDSYDYKTGNREQKSKGGFRTQKEAQAHLTTVLAQVQAGGYIEPSKEPFARYLEGTWLPAIRSTVRPLTHTSYRRVVAVHIARRDIGGKPLRNLTGGDLTALYAELEHEGLSVAYRRLIHSTLRRALNDAVRWDKITRNPASAADPPSATSTRAQSWSPRELCTFLDHVRSDRLYALWRLAATTGMRRGELLGLGWRAVELENARLRVERQLIPLPRAARRSAAEVQAL